MVLIATTDESRLKAAIATELDASRARSLYLTGLVDDADLVRQHSRLMSPLVWDLAHVGNQEELWLLRRIAGTTPLLPGIDELYDAFKHPRLERPSLSLLDPSQSRRYIADVRDRALDVLDRTDLYNDNSLVRDGFVYAMIVQHEHQHDETMLATHQLRDGPRVLHEQTPLPRPAGEKFPDEVLIPAGTFLMGTTNDAFALDNERPAHEVDVPAFLIDTVPVSNRNYVAFIEAGGYLEPRFWSEQGWRWRLEADSTGPQFWRREGGVWVRHRFGADEELPLDEPVQHVCWYEAEAFARWSGKRLPTEAEWEKAAAWDPDAGRHRRWPWGDDPPGEGHANLGQRHLRPAPVGCYPDGASAYGVRQMIGDVWEWTASDFLPYPGFVAFPYREYSEVFFGHEYKVLRGGSWATDPNACRTTFRNWDFPIRRQIFAGFRCARDVA